MQPIKVFYHLACIFNYNELFQIQLAKIKQSGLYEACTEIVVCLLGDSSGFRINDPKIRCVKLDAALEEGELPTLRVLASEAAKEHFYVLYLHCKGVSRRPSVSNFLSVRQIKNYITGRIRYKNVVAWRNYMEHFLVFGWRDCVCLLDVFDAVGVEWKDAGTLFDMHVIPYGHYSGNFWWSHSVYLGTLPDVYSLIVPTIFNDRMRAEFWLGSLGEIKQKTLFQTGAMNLYRDNAQSLCRTRGVIFK